MAKKNGRLDVSDNQPSLKKKENLESTIIAAFLMCKIKYD